MPDEAGGDDRDLSAADGGWGSAGLRGRARSERADRALNAALSARLDAITRALYLDGRPLEAGVEDPRTGGPSKRVRAEFGCQAPNSAVLTPYGAIQPGSVAPIATKIVEMRPIASIFDDTGRRELVRIDIPGPCAPCVTFYRRCDG